MKSSDELWGTGSASTRRHHMVVHQPHFSRRGQCTQRLSRLRSQIAPLTPSARGEAQWNDRVVVGAMVESGVRMS